jgi:hypothetical protein
VRVQKGAAAYRRAPLLEAYDQTFQANLPHLRFCVGIGWIHHHRDDGGLRQKLVQELQVVAK